MATIAEFRTGLAETLSELGDVTVYRLPQDNVVAPAIIIAGVDGRPDTNGAGFVCQADLYVIVSRSHVDQVEALDALVDPNNGDSIPALLAADPSLNGSVSSSQWVTVGAYREIEAGGTGYYGATVTVEALL